MLSNHHSDELAFELIEQVELNVANKRCKYWFAELYNEYIARPNTPINYILLEHLLTQRRQSSSNESISNGQDNMKLAQLFNRNKEKYQLKSAKSIEDIQLKISQLNKEQENSNFSLPVVYHEHQQQQQHQQQVTSTSKHVIKSKNKRNKNKQQSQSQLFSSSNSMRRKSKSFENIPEESKNKF